MPGARASHDDRLLDALASLPETTFAATIWRVVNAMRSPVDGSRGSGRWNIRTSEVLYCSLEADGALAEIHYQINRGNTIFPSRLTHVLYEVRVELPKLLDLSNPGVLTSLGIDRDRYQEILYSHTQRVGEAAGFLGFEGIIVPNARHRSNNLVIFIENVDLDSFVIGDSTEVDWQTWRTAKGLI